MDSEKLRNRKYPTALELAHGEKDVLPLMYDSGKTVREIADHYSTTASTVVKALVFLGFQGPQWSIDACKRTLDRINKAVPSSMKRGDPLI